MRQSRRAYADGQRETSSTGSVSRVAVAKWDVLVKLEPRRGARDAPGTKLACGTSQVGMRSRHRCDTLSGRVPRRIGEGVERIKEEIWERLEETATKSGGEGEGNIVGKNLTKALRMHLQRPRETSSMIGLTHRRC